LIEFAAICDEPRGNRPSGRRLIFQQACEMGPEGIVSKRLSAPYLSGPSRHWLKIKNPASPAMVRVREA
jgi:ATP-dependent DNA ligase